jgi:hypothetical protein
MRVRPAVPWECINTQVRFGKSIHVGPWCNVQGPILGVPSQIACLTTCEQLGQGGQRNQDLEMTKSFIYR